MSRPQSISVILVAAIGLVSALRVSGAQQADEAIPDLGLPSGATGNGKSGSNGEGFSQSVIWIATNQTVGDVAGYYRRKLAEIGWRHSGDFTGKDLMVSRFASVAGTAATVGTLGVMPLNSGQIVVWVRRVRSLPPNASSGRVGGGGASMTGGEKATVGPPIDIAVRTLFGMAPTAPGGEQMAALQAVPAAFPKELIHPRFVASRIVGSPSRTTIAGVIQNAASPDATVLMSGAKKAGWIEYPGGRGFFTGRIATTVCRGSSEAALGFDELPNRVLVGMVSVSTAGSRCVQVASLSPPFTTPWLSVPTQWSARLVGSSGLAHRHSAARLNLVAPAVAFEHFDRQIIAAGYTKGTILSDGLELVARYTSAPGQPAAIVVLSVRSLPGGTEVDAVMEVFGASGR